MTPFQYFDQRKEYYCNLLSMDINKTDLVIYFFDSNKFCGIFYDIDFYKSINEAIEKFENERIPWFLEAKTNKEKASVIHFLYSQWMTQTDFPYTGFSNFFFKELKIKINIDDVLNEHKKYIGFCPGPSVIKDVMFEIGVSKSTNLIHIANVDLYKSYDKLKYI